MGGIATAGALGVATIPVPTEFLVDQKEINLNQLEAQILKQNGWKHAGVNGGKGFAGLDMDTVDVDGVPKTRIFIIWSDDGKNGYAKPTFTTLQKTRIQNNLNEHAK